MALSELGDGWRPHLERLFGAFSGLPPVPPETVGRAVRYLDLVAAWNARIDLTAAKTPEELVDLSFGDAAALVASGALTLNERWLDVGSGAGAPGLPLAVLEPRLAMTLLEPMQKRVAFLRTVIGALGVSIEVVRGRVENHPERSVGVAVSRAALPPDAWLAQGAKIATREVWVLLAREEPPALPGWVVGLDLSFQWPLTNRARRAVLFRTRTP